MIIFRFSKFVHNMLFNPKSTLFITVQRIARWIDSHTAIKSTFVYFEHLTKVAMYGCTDCGDCALTDVAYICPMSHCPKQQRNGPCGGSTGGWCEGYPGERRCIWNQAYERIKAGTGQSVISPYIIPPTNWKLKASSSWLNYYLGKDHTAIRLGVHPLEKQANDKGMIDTIKESIDSLVCSIDTDCPAGYICVEGRCIPQQI